MGGGYGQTTGVQGWVGRTGFEIGGVEGIGVGGDGAAEGLSW